MTAATKQDLIEIDGKWRPTTNSFGKLIHPTLEGIANFWRWFGDSQVVDNQGRPLVMYHYTGDVFPKFEIKKAQRWDHGFQGRGFYFGTRAFLRESAYGLDGADEWEYPEGSNVMPVYLSVKNPIIDAYGSSKNEGKAIDRSSGNDGVLVVGTDKSGYRLDRKAIINVVAWDPEQIKSATGNRGSFDPSDPIITNPRPGRRPSLR